MHLSADIGHVKEQEASPNSRPGALLETRLIRWRTRVTRRWERRGSHAAAAAFPGLELLAVPPQAVPAVDAVTAGLYAARQPERVASAGDDPVRSGRPGVVISGDQEVELTSRAYELSRDPHAPDQITETPAFRGVRHRLSVLNLATADPIRSGARRSILRSHREQPATPAGRVAGVSSERRDNHGPPLPLTRAQDAHACDRPVSACSGQRARWMSGRWRSIAARSSTLGDRPRPSRPRSIVRRRQRPWSPCVGEWSD